MYRSISVKLIGNQCLFDEECYGMNTVCRSGRCSCPTNFEEFDLDEKTTICRLGECFFPVVLLVSRVKLTINLIIDLCSALEYWWFVPARLQAAPALSWRQVRVLGRQHHRWKVPRPWVAFAWLWFTKLTKQLHMWYIVDYWFRFRFFVHFCMTPFLCANSTRIKMLMIFAACPPGQQLYGVECQRVAHFSQPCEKV